LIGEQSVNLIQAAYFHHRRAMELAVIGSEPYCPGMLQDATRYRNFSVVKVAQAPIGLNARNPDQANIDFELADEIERSLADNGAISSANNAPGDYHLAVRVVSQSSSDVQIVGDDAQVAMLKEFGRDGFDGRSNI
jgi:hypothetical protein